MKFGNPSVAAVSDPGAVACIAVPALLASRGGGGSDSPASAQPVASAKRVVV
jgi:hypothetical protein